MAKPRLTCLTVKNLALVRQADIEFEAGLNVVTGETGAGKSVLIGALKLLTGERADKSLVRHGENQCSAEAEFELTEPATIDALLESHGVDPCEDGRLILRRVVKAAGGGQARVNHCTVTLALLKQIGELLVDMHGPYDHQSLLRTETQLGLLDAYGKTSKELAAYRDLFRDGQALRARRAELDRDADSVSEQIDVLTFRIREMKDGELREDEEDRINAEHALVANAQTLGEAGSAAAGTLEGDAFEAMVRVRRALDDLGDKLPAAEAWRKEAESITISIRELGADLRSVLDRVDTDPARLQWLEDRLATYRSLKRKYGPGTSDVLAHLAEAQQRLHDLEHRDEQIQALDAEIAALTKRLEAAGGKLGAKRRRAAAKLAAAITEHLGDLGFENGRFEIGLESCEPRADGMDGIDFGFAPNVGEAMRPLKAIASSGEIARVMLACKAVLAEHDAVPLLVFDEIDANVGGEMGRSIGGKMTEVARHHQVVAITHLPQVAVHGGHHLRVEKVVEGERTITQVDALEGEDRLEEIARMLGDREAAATRAHAAELLASAG